MRQQKNCSATSKTVDAIRAMVHFDRNLTFVVNRPLFAGLLQIYSNPQPPYASYYTSDYSTATDVLVIHVCR